MYSDYFLSDERRILSKCKYYRGNPCGARRRKPEKFSAENIRGDSGNICMKITYKNEKHLALDKVFFIYLVCIYKPNSVSDTEADDKYLSRPMIAHRLKRLFHDLSIGTRSCTHVRI